MMEAASALVAWFRTRARDLPWRGPFPRDPYRVLVAEVMLQQTQVERVVEPYSRFLERFPSVEALAAAPVQAVLHAFSGLGYYRRARSLHAAAATLAERGGWPRDAAALATLPGFGPYTSAAVAAFAFAGRTPPVDGNVERVAARVLAVAERVGSSSLRRRSADLAAELHRRERTPEVFEGLMELGARVCTRADPACQQCPLSVLCAACREGEVGSYPLPRRGRRPEGHRWVALWAKRDDGRVILVARPVGSLLGGLFLPPLGFLASDQDPAAAAEEIAADLGLGRSVELVGAVRHGITHRRIEVSVYRIVGRVRCRVAEPRPDVAWDDPNAPAVPTSSLTAKIQRLCVSQATHPVIRSSEMPEASEDTL